MAVARWSKSLPIRILLFAFTGFALLRDAMATGGPISVPAECILWNPYLSHDYSTGLSNIRKYPCRDVTLKSTATVARQLICQAVDRTDDEIYFELGVDLDNDPYAYGSEDGIQARENTSTGAITVKTGKGVTLFQQTQPGKIVENKFPEPSVADPKACEDGTAMIGDCFPRTNLFACGPKGKVDTVFEVSTTSSTLTKSRRHGEL